MSAWVTDIFHVAGTFACLTLCWIYLEEKISTARNAMPKLVAALDVAVACLKHYDNPHADDRGAPAEKALAELDRICGKGEEA